MGSADGSIDSLWTIHSSGSPTQKWNLVLVGDGFTSNEQQLFADRALAFANAFTATSPFNQLAAAINIFGLRVHSDDTGADFPSPPFGAAANADTYFDASFGYNGIPRLLTANTTLLGNVLHAQLPQWHCALLIVNSQTSGGSGLMNGHIAVASIGESYQSWIINAIHEIGHAAFGLADEYEYMQSCSESQATWPAPVRPAERNIDSWPLPPTPHWTVASVAPTQANPSDNCRDCQPFTADRGAFEGAGHYHQRLCRPHCSCRMRSGQNFCGVCASIIENFLSTFQ